MVNLTGTERMLFSVTTGKDLKLLYHQYQCSVRQITLTMHLIRYLHIYTTQRLTQVQNRLTVLWPLISQLVISKSPMAINFLWASHHLLLQMMRVCTPNIASDLCSQLSQVKSATSKKPHTTGTPIPQGALSLALARLIRDQYHPNYDISHCSPTAAPELTLCQQIRKHQQFSLKTQTRATHRQRMAIGMARVATMRWKIQEKEDCITEPMKQP